MWKTRSAIDFSRRGRLTADIRIASLEQWSEIQTALGSVGNVTGVTVTAIDTNYARITIAYLGGIEQVREALAGAGVSLTHRGRAGDAGKAQRFRDLPNRRLDFAPLPRPSSAT